ncbi:winged helix-turn-helix domain-containing protein [Salinigranum halophilum]|uniref:winged helix-turn-helix domain-containing protein n=1 Tax=Salinigranum halophilum TaxID=2565931 RepID=UPI001375DEC0|nr:helix-turn-helix domain-containing protein [Salinigranum halophilum]
MGPSDGRRDASTVSPAEAFGALSNETRIQILRALSDAGRPLSFSELRDRVGVRHGGKFNYHLDKLVGHFVDKVDAGYTLCQPGDWVVRAIRSGTLTGGPTVDPAEVDLACARCEVPLEVRYYHGAVRVSCPACRGTDETATVRRPERDVDHGTVAVLPLPPAGVQGRTAMDILRAAATWTHLDALAVASGVCPTCSAAVERFVRVCEAHDAVEERCDRCGRHPAVCVEFRCANCTDGRVFDAVTALLYTPELLAFVKDHGLDPTADIVEWSWDYSAEVRSTDPVELRFVFALDGEELTLTVDGDLSVVDVTRRDDSEVA